MKLKWAIFTLLITTFTALAVGACLGYFDIISFDKRQRAELESIRYNTRERLRLYDSAIAVAAQDAEQSLKNQAPTLASSIMREPIETWTPIKLQELSESTFIKHIYVIDKQNTIIASTDKAMLTQPLSKVSQVSYEKLQTLRGQASLKINDMELDPLQGQPRICAYFSPDNSESLLLFTMDLREVVRNWYSPEFERFLFDELFYNMSLSNPNVTNIRLYVYGEHSTRSLQGNGEKLDPEIVQTVMQKKEYHLHEHSRVSAFYLEDISQDSNTHMPHQMIAQVDYNTSDRQSMILNTLLHTLYTLPAVIVVAFLIGYFMIRRDLITPVGEITDGLERITQGNYNEEIKVADRQQDLRQVAESINIMQGYIKQRECQLTEAREELEQRVEERTSELAASKDRYKKMATTDELTGLANRRHFMKVAEEEIQRAKRYEHPLCIIMLDIDHFKKVNDTYGHASGDCVLQTIAKVGQDTIREIDLLARLGGEEFAILLPETDREGAVLLAERLRHNLQAAETPCAEEPEKIIRITVSQGVGEFSETNDSLSALLKRADKSLYAAKADGRNCVKCALS